MSLYFVMFSKTLVLEWEISCLNSANLVFPIILDPMGLVFLTTVLFISGNVLFFATSYMQHDLFMPRFIYLVLLFVLSMALLILIPNLITLLIGWDGLGLVSFLLVIYYQNPKSLSAGMITALSNRIGDAMLLLAIGWTLAQGHWMAPNMWESHTTPWVCLTIMIAAMTKSAQMPFSSWLPAAMAAPTPVSALVHSSTLVTAGVFLMIRFYPFLHSIWWFNPSILIISSMTMLMAGMSAMVECDLKKIIALSTLSQLGVMMASLGLGLPLLAFFHLITHALFKALLFLCGGAIIHMNGHSQDLRTVGAVFHQSPMLTTALLTANLALCGTPFLAGFYSKDVILELSLALPTNIIILAIFMFATMLTASYSARMMVLAIWAPNSSFPMNNFNDSDNFITFPMILMSTMAISAGSLINWAFMAPVQELPLPTLHKFLPLLVTLLGALLIAVVLPFPSLSTPRPTKFQHALSFMWFLSPISSQFVLAKTLSHTHLLFKVMDQGWLETVGGQGLHLSSSNMSSSLQIIQRNSINIQILTTAVILAPILLL
uniref:NADH-ubiquinone oxidoreductase chain 5 n=1 Tax=Pharyngocirrus uchidai TaxID=2498818 RepID=A0A7G9IX13_9ANNE|nr:NADH dehydrogenase subunit 5 [Pharyngocirrus uchidai]QNM39907.1 NADH dehydrogenase subunit 5 [Pharyngocirrus uchidai]